MRLVQLSMHEVIAVDGSPLGPESIRMMEYLRTRAAALTPAAICERVRAAAAELETAVGAVPEAEARVRPIAGKWTIAEVVDHISQTQIRGTEELRHLLAGRRPPLPPVYEALRSGAGQWAPWNMLVAELKEANRAMVDVLATAQEGERSGTEPTVRTVMVALQKQNGEAAGPQIFFASLGWKEYALLQRLHLIDHRRQVKNLRAVAASPVL
jgi:hypothetical protein